MNAENQEKLADILDSIKSNTLPEDLEGELYKELIGVDASDAKEWYGGGISPLKNIDRALQFVRRVASPAVLKRFEPHTDFKVLWASTLTLEAMRNYDPAFVPLAMISTVLRANVHEFVREELEKKHGSEVMKPSPSKFYN